MRQEPLDGSPAVDASPAKWPFKGELKLLDTAVAPGLSPVAVCDCRLVCYREAQSQEGETRARGGTTAGRRDADGHNGQEMDAGRAAEAERGRAHLPR